MRAIWEEVRRTFRMTFGEEVRTAFKQGKSHRGWGADPHLMKGWLCAAPVFVAGLVVVFTLFGRVIARNTLLFYAFGLPVALLANLVWFGVAAHSRARSAKG